MKRVNFSVFVLILTLCLILSLRPVVNEARASVPDYPNTHINTGNQRKDILAVALTQLGYTEGVNNHTKYGAWGGFPNQPWCANFVSWCARQAEISEAILQKSPVASPKRFNIPYHDGTSYIPQPGDLFFTKEFSHVGLVYYTEGEYFYTVEGNVNIDENEDGYYVMTLKRKISDYYFGVPAYEGGGKDHDYVRHQEAAHPHKIYYECSICGDKYYTGYDEVVQDCASCFTCGCDSRYAGYYLSAQEKGTYYIRSDHGQSNQYVGCLIKDAVVYVHGINPNTGWAYIEYDGVRGHYKTQYLKKYYPAPQTPNLTVADRTYIWGDDVTFTWNQPANAEEYRIEIYLDGEAVVDEILGNVRSYSLQAAKAGRYEIRLTAANRTGWSAPAELSLWVRSTCTVSFDAAGGSGAPETVTHIAEDVLKLPTAVPQREGYTFLGWTEDAQGRLARYPAGGELVCSSDMIFYAVWKEDSAVPESLSIEQLPQRTMFCVGEALDTTGLILCVGYTDGSARLTGADFTTDGYQSAETGVQTVTVICEGLSVTYDVEIVTHFPGDINLDNIVNRDDVMELLWHITFPEEFPIEVPADFTGDGTVNRDDVMQLLWHITFPDLFPLG